MVKILNIALYIIFILIPALYFIWLLKHEHLIFKTFVVVMAILSTIGILLKFSLININSFKIKPIKYKNNIKISVHTYVQFNQ